MICVSLVQFNSSVYLLFRTISYGKSVRASLETFFQRWSHQVKLLEKHVLGLKCLVELVTSVNDAVIGWLPVRLLVILIPGL